MVLQNRRQPLVQKVLQTEMVGADDELTRPQVGTPVANHLDEPN
jgi:hypothetical protein